MGMSQLIAGTKVKVQCYGGEILTRRVVRDGGRTVIVCNESEYRDAIREGRKPDGIGFPHSAVQVYNRYEENK